MVLMNHIISDLKFRKTLYLSPFIGLTLLLFLRLSEDIRLRDHRKLQHRILIAICYMSISRHNLSGRHFPVQLIAVIAAQIIIP